MLRLLIGTDWTANRDEIFARIARDVAQKQPGRILLIPELISHDTERRLCMTAGDTASRYAQVLSFTLPLGLSPRPYLLGKLLQSLLSAIIALPFARFLPQAVQTIFPRNAASICSGQG